MIISWNTPNNNGSPITSYQISIKCKDGVYNEDLQDCDGTTTEIITSAMC